MTASVPATPRHLTRGQVFRFRRSGRLCLRVDSGSLWITIDGQLDDIELDAGHSRAFDNARKVLVSSLGGESVFSEVPLTERHAGSAGWRQRLDGWLHGSARPAFLA